MADIVEKIKEVARTHTHIASNQTAVAEMQELYLKLIRCGIIRKPEYDLPPLDTVGSRTHAMFRHQRPETETK